jgi:integrase
MATVENEKERKCAVLLERLRKRLSAEDYASVERFDKELKAAQRSVSVRHMYLYAVDVLTSRVMKSFKSMNKADIVDFFAALTQEREESTIINFKTKIKRFFQYVYGMEERNYPEPVKWIRGKRYQTKLKKSDLLAPEELESMINACRSQMQRAFISGLFESKCRPEEFLNLRLRNVEVNTYGVRLSIDTEKLGGTRVVPLVRSSPEIVLWLRMHPFREEPDAPLWVVTFPKPVKKRISYRRALQIVKSAAKAAGIKKRVWMYQLRHTSITDACTRIKEPVLRRLVGWSEDSKMPSVYEHLSGIDAETAVLEAEGVQLEPQPEYLGKLVECPRCKFKVTKADAFCPTCGLPLKEELAASYERREKADEVMNRLFSDPEFREFVSKRLRQLRITGEVDQDASSKQ